MYIVVAKARNQQYHDICFVGIYVCVVSESLVIPQIALLLKVLLEFNLVNWTEEEEISNICYFTFYAKNIFCLIFFRNFKLPYDVKTIVCCHISHLKKKPTRILVEYLKFQKMFLYT